MLFTGRASGIWILLSEKQGLAKPEANVMNFGRYIHPALVLPSAIWVFGNRSNNDNARNALLETFTEVSSLVIATQVYIHPALVLSTAIFASERFAIDMPCRVLNGLVPYIWQNLEIS